MGMDLSISRLTCVEQQRRLELQKKDDFVKGVAQCAVQLESSLSNRKRKLDEMDEEQTFGRVFGIVTDAEKFYFMECSMDDQDRPKLQTIGTSGRYI